MNRAGLLALMVYAFGLVSLPAIGGAAAVGLPDRNPRHAETPGGGAGTPEAKAEIKADTKAETKAETKESGPDYRSILKPVLSFSASEADKDHLKEAVRLSYTGNGAQAADEIAAIDNPAVRKLALWYAYKSEQPPADARAIEAFRLANPDWPAQEELRAAAERQLFLSDDDAGTIIAFFEAQPPETGAGKAALARAYLKRGDKQRAKELITAAWRGFTFDDKVEKKLLAEFGGMLEPADHTARIDMLLYPDRSNLTDDADRTAKLLPEAERKKVAARIAVVKRRSNAGKLLEAIPDDQAKDDVGLLFNRIQYLRRSDKEEDAWKLMLSAPRDAAQLGDLEQWWIERRINCRMALRFGNYKVAYQIAAQHGPIEGDHLTEAEFLAGWIALRFLNEPRKALGHFVALRSAADGSKTLARAEYWLGRTAEALGDRGTAIVHYVAASRFPQHYYGQLGRQALDEKPAKLEVTATPVPTEEDIDRFLGRDAVQAIGAALAADYPLLTPSFFIALARRLESPAEIVLLAELAKLSGDRQISIRVAKIAFNRDMPVGDYALPVGVLPSFVRLSDKVDLALVHALSRQESEFNAEAKSPAGARGLMQLMPSTARLVARQFNVTYSPSKLNDPAYNVQLGEAHLGDLIKNYDGSYFLALVAYNAGPGRVKEWIEAFGDPRDPRVDPIDWVECIPFTETREYVIKIMESLQLYRSRLEGKEHALRLWQDLHRGRPGIGVTGPATDISIQASSD